MKHLLTLLLLLCPAIAIAETHVYPKEGHSIAVVRTDEAKSQWSILAIDFDKKQITPVIPTILEDGLTCIIEGVPGSQCAVMRYSSTGIQKEALVITLGLVVPKPPDTPQDPNTNPPVPSPGTPLTGMRVLILEESSPTAALPKSQVEALHSPTIIAYLDKKAMDTGGNRRWRKLDPDVSTTNLPQPWQSLRAAATPQQDQPWVVVSGSFAGTEKIVFNGPYPATPEAALAFFKKYGGD